MVTVSGDLDASSAAIFKSEVEKAAESKPSKLVLMMSGLEYMASAGLRVLIFAKQKMGANVDIYVVGAQEMVLDTLEKTGFDQGVIIVDDYSQVAA
ncbi:MAG: STAS domain-containing protein [Calothrix sp. SM1_7_51]|nr:STAS domain-containing protein [Calothrix sp. SM1_7_51]